MEIVKLFEQMQLNWLAFEENHIKSVEKGNKQAAKRARAALNDMKKLITPYKKASVIEVKKEK